MSAKYYLYRNLKIKTGGFSIKRNGLVVDRGTLFTMNNATFKINQIGRAQVRKKKQKNVHAYVVAKKYYHPAMVAWSVYDIIQLRGYKQVSYNPYGENCFFIVETNEPIKHARHVICIDGRVYAYV